MRGVQYAFASFDELTQELKTGSEDRGIRLPCAEGLRDGEWLLASFEVGQDCIAVAGQVSDRGFEVRLIFEERDWRRLCEFATDDSCCSGGRPSTQLPAFSLQAPPNSRVLVVDDDTDLQRMVSCMLQSKGFQVSAVSSAEEAYPHVRDAEVDLVILDWNLPGMSGVEFVRRIRSELAATSLPVLFLTANTSPRDVAEAFSAGADDFVSKPFRAPELGARIIGLLRRSAIPAASGY